MVPSIAVPLLIAPFVFAWNVQQREQRTEITTMPVSQELLTAVFKDLVLNEKATRDEWISTKAIKALMEYRYNLHNLDATQVSIAIKHAVEQEKEEKGWDWHVYKKTVWVWATGEYRAMEPVTYEADNEGKQARQ